MFRKSLATLLFNGMAVGTLLFPACKSDVSLISEDQVRTEDGTLIRKTVENGGSKNKSFLGVYPPEGRTAFEFFDHDGDQQITPKDRGGRSIGGIDFTYAVREIPQEGSGTVITYEFDRRGYLTISKKSGYGNGIEAVTKFTSKENLKQQSRLNVQYGEWQQKYNEIKSRR